MGAELLHADRQTDMTKPTVAFRNFANAPKNSNKRGGKFSGKFQPSEHYMYDHKYPTGGGHVKLSRP